MNLMIPTPGWSGADGRVAVVRCHQGLGCAQSMIVTIHVYLVFKFGTGVCLVPGASLGSFESWDVYINTLIEDVSRG